MSASMKRNWSKPVSECVRKHGTAQEVDGRQREPTQRHASLDQSTQALFALLLDGRVIRHEHDRLALKARPLPSSRQPSRRSTSPRSASLAPSRDECVQSTCGGRDSESQHPIVSAATPETPCLANQSNHLDQNRECTNNTYRSVNGAIQHDIQQFWEVEQSNDGCRDGQRQS